MVTSLLNMIVVHSDDAFMLPADGTFFYAMDKEMKIRRAAAKQS